METKFLGRISYEKAWALQLELVGQHVQGLISDTLLVLEHEPVITMGRRLNKDAPPSIGGVPVFPVERGGEATFHGPGQIVLYPIFHLDIKFGPKAFLRMLEEVIIAVLSRRGLEAYFIEGKTGVWLVDHEGRERKIASLGIAVKGSVSYHGLALNVNTDLNYFKLISPCGFLPEVMTSVSKQLGSEQDMDAIGQELAAELIYQYQNRKHRWAEAAALVIHP